MMITQPFRDNAALRDQYNRLVGLSRRQRGNTVAARLRRARRNEINHERRGLDAFALRLEPTVTVVPSGNWADSKWKRDRVARPGGKRTRKAAGR